MSEIFFKHISILLILLRYCYYLLMFLAIKLVKVSFYNYMLFDGPEIFNCIFSRPLCRDKLIGTYTPGICDALI